MASTFAIFLLKKMELASEEILLSLQQKYNYLRFLFVEFVISRQIGCISAT